MNKVKVCELKIVNFPAGYLRALHSNDANHIAWVRGYTMLVPKRGGIVFTDASTLSEDHNATKPLSRAALRRLFGLALGLRPSGRLIDSRTEVNVRRIGSSDAFEISMPCGEVTCVKKGVIKRLSKELEPESDPRRWPRA